MARIEWVKHRLDNWARWKITEQDGGHGYPTSSSFLHDAATDRYRESKIPIDEIEASVTDQAVEALRPDRQHLHDTLTCIYIAGIGVKETARRTFKAESTIKAHLDQADHALSLWFRERAAKRSSTS